MGDRCAPPGLVVPEGLNWPGGVPACARPYPFEAFLRGWLAEGAVVRGALRGCASFGVSRDPGLVRPELRRRSELFRRPCASGDPAGPSRRLAPGAAPDPPGCATRSAVLASSVAGFGETWLRTAGACSSSAPIGGNGTAGRRPNPNAPVSRANSQAAVTAAAPRPMNRRTVRRRPASATNTGFSPIGGSACARERSTTFHNAPGSPRFGG